jgi:hypothetical protein
MTPNVQSAGGDNPKVRSAGRRPALPNGRAVVGGLLVTAAAVGTFAAWSGADDPPSARLVVAARDLAVGEVVAPGDVTLVAIDAPGPLAARAFDAVEPVVGQRTVAPLAAGELVQRSAVVVPDGATEGRQLSFAIDRADALAGTLQVGEPVDVYVTNDDETQLVAHAATVAGLDTGDDDLGSTQLTVLLTVTPDTDVLAVTDAVRTGDITLVRDLGA